MSRNSARVIPSVRTSPSADECGPVLAGVNGRRCTPTRFQRASPLTPAPRRADLAAVGGEVCSSAECGVLPANRFSVTAFALLQVVQGTSLQRPADDSPNQSRPFIPKQVVG